MAKRTGKNNPGRGNSLCKVQQARRNKARRREVHGEAGRGKTEVKSGLQPKGKGKSEKAFKHGSDTIRSMFLKISLIAARQVDWRGPE